MSTGLFMGVRGSFIDGAEPSAKAFLDAVNHALGDKGFAPYLDPPEPPNVYKGHLFGRSELDHHSSRVFAQIASLGTESRENPNLELIRNNPYRVTFVPTEFTPPALTEYYERICGEAVQIWVRLVATFVNGAKAACRATGYSSYQWRSGGCDRHSHQRLRAASKRRFSRTDRGRQNCLASTVRRLSFSRGA
jgi:hypothetical protein